MAPVPLRTRAHGFPRRPPHHLCESVSVRSGDVLALVRPRVAEAVAVDHGAVWSTNVRRSIPSTCMVLLEPDVEAYVTAIAEHGRFHIVVVDGLARPQFAAAAMDGLKDDRSMIWDKSHSPDFGEVFPLPHEDGFRRLDFTGLGPTKSMGQASVLYRADNFLGT